MRKIFCTITLSLIIFISCKEKNQNQNSTSAIPYEATLTVSNTLQLDSDQEFVNPLRILNVNDEYLVTSNIISPPNDFIKVFKIPELEYLYTWGREGRGPDEVLVSSSDISSTSDRIDLFEPQLQQIRRYIVNDTSFIHVEQFNLSYKTLFSALNRVLRINDSLYFADYNAPYEGNTEDHEQIALQPNNLEPLFTFGRFPEDENIEIEEDDNRLRVYRKTNMVKPDGSRFAVFYLAHNRFKIYDNKGNEIVFREISDPENNVEYTSRRYLYRASAYASNNYMYTIGFNNYNDELFGNFEDPDLDFQTSIEVWDWEGNPVYRAKFDRLISNFTVSEEHKKIYGYNIYVPDEFYEYDLPEF